MTLEMLVIKIPETEDGSRIDRCIRRILGNINQAMLEKYLRSGLILLDNKKIKDLNFQVFRRYPELDQTGRSFIIRQLKKQIGGLKKEIFI